MAATTSTVKINGVSITLTPGSTVVVNGISATLDAYGHFNVTTSAAPEQSVANDVTDDSDAEHETETDGDTEADGDTETDDIMAYMANARADEDTEADEGLLGLAFYHAWLLNLLAASTKDYPYLDAFNLDHKGIVLHSVEYQTQDSSTKHYESFAIDHMKNTGKDYLIAGKIEDGSWRSLYASRLFPKFISLGSLPPEILAATK